MYKYESTGQLLAALKATNSPKELSDKLFGAATTISICTFTEDGEKQQVACTIDGGLLHDVLSHLHMAINNQLQTRLHGLKSELRMIEGANNEKK